jgi:hypothetical protein
MKKTFFWATILVALIFAGCDKSGNGGDLKITASVENGSALNALIDEVRVTEHINEDGEGTDVIIATAPFKNGGFTITLPDKIDERLIELLFDETPSSITVSNKDVAGIFLIDEFSAYKSNEYVGEIFCGYEQGTETNYMGVRVAYVFVDADVKVTGSYTDPEDEDWTEIYDVNLKKGWNTVYLIETEDENGWSGTCTTTKPSADLKWYFDGGNYYAPRKATKKHSFTFLK